MKVISTRYIMRHGQWVEFAEEFNPMPHDVDMSQVVSVEQNISMSREEFNSMWPRPFNK